VLKTFSSFLLVLLISVVRSQTLHGETLTFDSLRSNDLGGHRVADFDGFYFAGFYSINYGNTGADIVIETANWDDYGGFFPESGNPFTLNSLVIVPGNGNGLPDEIDGYRNGVLVDEALVSDESNTGVLTLNWSNIDKVTFPNAFDQSLIPSYDRIHSITIDDPIVPEPASVILLLIGVICGAARCVTGRSAGKLAASRQ
jgi:hypothetical protein